MGYQKHLKIPFMVVLALTVPPALSFFLAYQLLDYFTLVDHPFLGMYFMLGGHAATLFVIWAVCAACMNADANSNRQLVSNRMAGLSVLVATIYLITAAICWIATAIGSMSFP